MKHIILSDTHFGMTGAEGSGYYSVLSSGNNVPEEMKNQMKDKIDALYKVVADFSNGESITLIGSGDIMDLAMSHMRPAVAEFINFLSKFPMINELIYVVGNHDHHIWTLHEEQIRLIEPMMDGLLPEPNSVFESTKEEGEESLPLSIMFSKQLGREFRVRIAYPVLKMNSPEGDMLITHGHLFGDLYVMVSDVLIPYLKTTNMLHAQAVVNAPVVEFVDWLLGEMGESMGASGGLSSTIYADTQKGDASSVSALINRAVDVLLNNGIINGIPDSWEKWIVKKISNRAVKESLPHMTGLITSADRYKDTSATRSSCSNWFKEVGVKDVKVFVSGHTHIGDDFVIDGIRCLNAGGWEVEPSNPNVDGRVILIGDKIELKEI